MNRGNRKTVIFYDDRDRKRFLRLLIEAAIDHGVEIQCGTQMGTHFHVVVVTPHANVSAFMQDLQGRYAEYINWRYGLVGHLFQGRFRAVVIEDDLQFFTAVWYVFNNPREGGYCARYEDWAWSTYAATVGLKPVPDYLSISWVETLFPAESLKSSQCLFRACMESPDPIDAYLQSADPTMPAAIRSYISDRLKEMQLPCAMREATRPPLEQLFAMNQSKTQRDCSIRTAKVVYGYTLAEIAKVLHLHPASVSRIFCDSRRRAAIEIGDEADEP
jgi:putative transposase